MLPTQIYITSYLGCVMLTVSQVGIQLFQVGLPLLCEGKGGTGKFIQFVLFIWFVSFPDRMNQTNEMNQKTK